MHNIMFADAGFLLLLIVALPLTAALWLFAYRSFLKARARYGESRLVDRYSKRLSLRTHAAGLIGWLLVVALVALAAAGPYTPAAPQHVSAGSLQVVTVMDVSRSMGATDYANSSAASSQQFFGAQGTRLGEAENVLENDIMPSIINNQLALITYQGTGYPLVDLTNDFGYVSWVVQNWLSIGEAPAGAANMGSGLLAAVKEFQRYGNPHTAKVIVLFSDGEDADQSTLVQAEQEIAAMHIKLVVIGLGGNRPVPVPAYNSSGQFIGYYQYSNGQIALTAQNTSLLQSVASATGGSYINMQPGSSGPRIGWPSALAPVTKVVVNKVLLYMYPLELAFLIVLLLGARGTAEAFFGSSRRRLRKPRRESK